MNTLPVNGFEPESLARFGTSPNIDREPTSAGASLRAAVGASALPITPSRVEAPLWRNRALGAAIGAGLTVACGNSNAPPAVTEPSYTQTPTTTANSSSSTPSPSTPSSEQPTTSGPTVPSTTTTTTPVATSEPPAEGVPDESLPLTLHGSPLVFAPTDDGFSLNAVVASGRPAALTARLRAQPSGEWLAEVTPRLRAADVVEWEFSRLSPAARYEYELLVREPNADGGVPAEPRVVHRGTAVTRRQPGSSFQFALLSDTHIGPNLDYHNQGDEEVTARISSEISATESDFVVNLGDLLDYHEYGFNVPPPTAGIARNAYLNYRGSMGETIGQMSHFAVIGNWDGENGEFSDEQIARSRQQRLLYMPNPRPDTNPQGGSPGEDYYAFAWGDALFVVLNVMTYTTTPHLLNSAESPEDWTLGPTQLQWLERTLQGNTSRWKFLLIHHAVGGGGPSAANAAYGRGGGLAANVGEQAVVHALMRQHGVQVFFYGHDHVVVDMTVDGIHYTQPGSAGAPWKFESSETGYTEYWTDSGWSRVQVSPDQVHVELISEAGQVLHDYRLPAGSEEPSLDAGSTVAGDASADAALSPGDAAL